MTLGPTRTVLTSPAPGTLVSPVHNYSATQTTQIQELREYGESLLLPDTDPYHPWELRWLNRPDTLPRYMRAAKWCMTDARKRVKATMEWRREYKPDIIPPDEVKIESQTGKIILNGFDKDGRPILSIRPGRENTDNTSRQVRHLVWWLERARDLMPPGQETIVIVVDYKSTTLKTNPSISVAKKVLSIVQQHYVETLGRAYIVNLPPVLNFFFKKVSPFMDPITREKMRFNPDLLELIPASQLDAEFGGRYNFEFQPENYWQQIVKACHIAPDGTRLNPDEESPDGSIPLSESNDPAGTGVMSSVTNLPNDKKTPKAPKMKPSKNAKTARNLFAIEYCASHSVTVAEFDLVWNSLDPVEKQKWDDKATELASTTKKSRLRSVFNK